MRHPSVWGGPEAMGTRRRCTLVVLVVGCVASFVTVSPADATPSGMSDPSFSAPFTTSHNSFNFGQAPSWTPDGRVLSNERDGAGIEQVFVSRLDGSAGSCLTCGQPGPNGFPQERAQGDWILFCSWRGQSSTFGAPCLGGVGTDLYVMRPDGTHVRRLTAPGTELEPNGEPFDNYHPYWSPDGRHIVWTHVGYGDPTTGGTKWSIIVADFVANGPGPRVANVRVAAPPTNSGYETQAWAPDGSGFLYTAMGQGSAGWLNLELYFLRLHGMGATAAHPNVTHLTDDNAGWDEQAVFTPDMRSVIWMSSRGSPTWYQRLVTSARRVRYNPPRQNDTFGPMFIQTISDPAFHTDLYQLDLNKHVTRRLTDLGIVIPEFAFDRAGVRLLWSEGRRTGTYIGLFRHRGAQAAVAPRVTPDLHWIGVSAPNDIAVPEPTNAPLATATGSLPQAVVDGAVLFQRQLTELAARTSAARS